MENKQSFDAMCEYIVAKAESWQDLKHLLAEHKANADIKAECFRLFQIKFGD